MPAAVEVGESVERLFRLPRHVRERGAALTAGQSAHDAQRGGVEVVAWVFVVGREREAEAHDEGAVDADAVEVFEVFELFELFDEQRRLGALVSRVNRAHAWTDEPADSGQAPADEAEGGGAGIPEKLRVVGIAAGGEAELGDRDRLADGQEPLQRGLVPTCRAALPVVVDGDDVEQIPVRVFERQRAVADRAVVGAAKRGDGIGEERAQAPTRSKPTG